MPVKLRIDRISRDGELHIRFNQKLIVPEFTIAMASEMRRASDERSLITYGDVDVT
jgi:hypothetical protein